MKQLLYLCVAASASLLASIANANEIYACQHNGIERTIRIVYENADSQVPCQVVYEKDSGTQTLWSAQNEADYCKAKAESFVEKQRGWGWDCAKQEATDPAQ